MDPLANPFIAAPAILTNASSVMALGTSKRFALSTELASQQAMPEALKQLRYASRRVRAMSAFYVSLGASLTSLVGAACSP
jgi:hypothetical protein